MARKGNKQARIRKEAKKVAHAKLRYEAYTESLETSGSRIPIEDYREPFKKRANRMWARWVEEGS